VITIPKRQLIELKEWVDRPIGNLKVRIDSVEKSIKIMGGTHY